MAADDEVEDHAIGIEPPDRLELVNRMLFEDALYRGKVSVTAGVTSRWFWTS